MSLSRARRVSRARRSRRGSASLALATTVFGVLFAVSVIALLISTV